MAPKAFRRNKRSKRSRNNKRFMTEKLNGASMKIRPDPPAIVDRPWNNATVSFQANAPGVLNVETFTRAFITQVATPGLENLFDFRLQELRAWEIAGTNLAVDIYDLDAADRTATGEIPTVHRSQRDEPGRNHWASVGLKWAASQTNNTLLSGTAVDIASFATGSATPDIVIHLKILWRFHRDAGPAHLLTLKN